MGIENNVVITCSEKNVGHVFASSLSDEVILEKPAGAKLGLVHVIAEVGTGLSSPTITLKDGTREIGTWAVPSGDAVTIVSSSVALEIDGDLVAQVSSTGIGVSVWAVKV